MLGGSSAKNHFSPAPVALPSSHVVNVDDAPLNNAEGSVRSVVAPLAELYACAMAAALSSLMLSNPRLSCACDGRLPHSLRVVTPDCDVIPLVGHRGAVKLRLVGVMLGNATAITQSPSCRRYQSRLPAPEHPRRWLACELLQC